MRITLPFKDQRSADAVRKQLKDLGKKRPRNTSLKYSRSNILYHLYLHLNLNPTVISCYLVDNELKMSSKRRGLFSLIFILNYFRYNAYIIACDLNDEK